MRTHNLSGARQTFSFGQMGILGNKLSGTIVEHNPQIPGRNYGSSSYSEVDMQGGQVKMSGLG